MTVAIIVQARLGSTRLPGKVLMDLGGMSALAQCLRRCRATPGADLVVCAVPDGAADEPVADEARSQGVLVVRGPSEDVLKRYRLAADACGAELVMRVTSDCPLTDPALNGRLIERIKKDGLDLVVNNDPPSWPHGLDAEIFRAELLRRADDEATDRFDREHVTPWIRRHLGLKKENIAHPGEDLSRTCRWTLDYPEDHAFLAALFARLPAGEAIPGLDEVLARLAAEPALAGINRRHHGVRAVKPS